MDVPKIEIPNDRNSLAIQRESLTKDLLRWVELIRQGFHPDSKYCGGNFNLVDLISLVLNGGGREGINSKSSDKEIAETVLKIIHKNMVDQIVPQK